MIHRKRHTISIILVILAVMTVPGLLVGGMKISGNEQASTAKAWDVIANLRALKGAALMYYVDNISEDKNVTIPAKDDLLKYSDSIADIRIAESREQAEGGEYIITSLDESDSWYAGYKLAQTDTDIITKLAARAGRLGLLQADGTTPYEALGREIYIRIR